MLHAAQGDYAVAVALQTVAGRAENPVAVFAALEKLHIERQREGIGVLGYEQFIVGHGTARDRIFYQWASGATIGEEIGRPKRPILGLHGHVLFQAAAGQQKK
jgi:hypothetical protein